MWQNWLTEQMTHLKCIQTLPHLCPISCSPTLCTNSYCSCKHSLWHYRSPNGDSTTALADRQTKGLGTDVAQEATLSPGFRPWIGVGLAHIQSTGLECQTQHNSTSETQGLSSNEQKASPSPTEKLAEKNFQELIKLFKHYLHIVPIPSLLKGSFNVRT